MFSRYLFTRLFSPPLPALCWESSAPLGGAGAPFLPARPQLGWRGEGTAPRACRPPPRGHPGWEPWDLVDPLPAPVPSPVPSGWFAEALSEDLLTAWPCPGRWDFGAENLGVWTLPSGVSVTICHLDTTVSTLVAPGSFGVPVFRSGFALPLGASTGANLAVPALSPDPASPGSGLLALRRPGCGRSC